MVKTSAKITRTVDTLVKLDSRQATFIPTYRNSVELLEDGKTGISVKITYDEVYDKNNPDSLVSRQVGEIEVTTPEEEIPIKINETIETNTKEKTVIGIPWFYKAALWFTIIAVALFIIKKYLKWL